MDAKPLPHGASPAAAVTPKPRFAVRALKIFAALAALPLCAGMTLGAYYYFDWAVSRNAVHFKWFGWGALAFAILATLLWRPVKLHVFSNKLMSLLAPWFRLAPHCIPLYALLAAGAYVAINAFWLPLTPHFQWVAFVLGFLFAFHLAFALWSLRAELFSLVVVYAANLAFAVMLGGFLQHGEVAQSWPALQVSSKLGWKRSVALYTQIAAGAQRLVTRNVARASSEIEAE